MITPPMVLDTREEWFEAAGEALDDLLDRQRIFSADDLRDAVPAPGHPNWWGTLFGGAHRAGKIRPTGYIISRTKTRKGGVIRQWTRKDKPSGARRTAGAFPIPGTQEVTP